MHAVAGCFASDETERLCSGVLRPNSIHRFMAQIQLNPGALGGHRSTFWMNPSRDWSTAVTSLVTTLLINFCLYAMYVMYAAMYGRYYSYHTLLAVPWHGTGAHRINLAYFFICVWSERSTRNDVPFLLPQNNVKRVKRERQWQMHTDFTTEKHHSMFSLKYAFFGWTCANYCACMRLELTQLWNGGTVLRLIDYGHFHWGRHWALIHDFW